MKPIEIGRTYYGYYGETYRVVRRGLLGCFYIDCMGFVSMITSAALRRCVPELGWDVS